MAKALTDHSREMPLTKIGACLRTVQDDALNALAVSTTVFPGFLTQAYNLKAVADYETGLDSLLPPERASAANETAGRFVESLNPREARLGLARSLVAQR
jgi:hypothetical protein